MVSVVNTNINQISEQRIKENLKSSHEVLLSFFAEKNKNYSDSIDSFILTQANIRAVLGTVGGDNDDSLFDDEEDDDIGKIKDSSELIASTVEELPIFQKSDVFAIIDINGRVIFSKNNPEKFGQDFSQNKLIQTSLSGKEGFSFWSNQSYEGRVGSVLPTDASKIYQIFIKPVTFQSQVKGLVLVGFGLSQDLVSQLQSISNAKIGFGLLSSENILSHEIEEVIPFLTKNEKVSELFLFSSNQEIFVAYSAELKNSLGEVVGSSLLFRSMTQELEFYLGLKNLFLLIGIISGLIALLAAFFLSGSVTKAISSLIEGVDQVRKGNLEYQVTVQTKDEFRKLSDAFNTMTQGLKEKEMIKTTFKRYVNPKIVDDLLAEGEKLNLGGDRRHVVVFFSDIAGFTKISEKQTPEQTVQFLNRYLGAMTDLIESREGIVDKYIGDAILAYWVITQKNKSGYHKACEAAIKQQQIVAALRHEWASSEDLSQFSVRIGIHSGHVLMGNIGSESRMDYTVIGDAVNTAARLESVNKQYNTQIIVSEAVQSLVKDEFLCRELDSVYVVGKNERVRIFELHEDNKQDLVDSFHSALKLYRDGQFVPAKKEFEEHSSKYQDLVSQVFIDRCQQMIIEPPEQWDGVYKLNKK